MGACSLMATLLEHRWTALRQAVGKLQLGVTVTALMVLLVLEFMAAAYLVVPLGLLHMQHLRKWFASLCLNAKKQQAIGDNLRYWESPQHLLKSTLLKLQAVFLIRQHFRFPMQGKHMLVRTDNCTLMAYINRKGRVWFAALLWLVSLWLWASEH